jgi:hypothetical protein
MKRAAPQLLLTLPLQGRVRFFAVTYFVICNRPAAKGEGEEACFICDGSAARGER